MGKNPRILQSGHHSKDFYEQLWRCINSGNVWKGEFLNKRKNGDFYWEQASISPVLDKDGGIRHYIAVKEDITERKRNESALRESEQKLRDLNVSKDKFFSIMAHDIKNPLAAMIGYSDFLKQNYEKVPEAMRISAISGINQASRQLMSLLENLLEWSRSQLGLLKFRPAKWPLKTVTDSCVELVRHQAESSGITIDIETAELETLVFADLDMITIVLRNLLSNALKYTAESGKVVLTAARRAGWMEVSVIDNGKGIPANDLNNLFRIDVSPAALSQDKQRGTGLGLIICKDFVEQNGGIIGAESEPGQGSRFYFTLKIAS